MNSTPAGAADAAHTMLVVVTPGADDTSDAWLAAAREHFSGLWLAAGEATAERLGLSRLPAAEASLPAICRAITGIGHMPGRVVCLRAGTALPAGFGARLAALTASGGLPGVVVPLGAAGAGLEPFAGLNGAPASIDARARLVAACARNVWLPLDEIPEAGCILLDAGGVAHIADGKTPSVAALDGAYLPCPPASGTPAPVMPALGALRRNLAGLLQTGVTDLPALDDDETPLTLHISHNWGGGVARWISDFIAGDRQGRHLVLSAGSDFERQCYGQWLSLDALGPGRGGIQRWTLSPSINDTASRHAQYRHLLHWVIQRYGVGRVIVSSLIGHSLDALATGLPTIQVLHDYYPAWPLLDIDPRSEAGEDGRPDLERALRRHADTLLFRPRPAARWDNLKSAWADLTAEHGVALVAPGPGVAQRWRDLLGEARAITCIGHGFAGWPRHPEIKPVPRQDGRLRLVVVGRMQAGKGLGLLQAALPALKEYAHVTALGTGHGGKQLFGLGGIDVIYQYERDQLPDLLATLKPHAALFLSTVAETWNYTLSELRGLGIVPIATRLGSFAERIRDAEDGILIEPSAEALVQAVRALHAAPERFDTLQPPSEPGLDSMVAAYDRLCPADRPSVAPVTAATAESLETLALAGELTRSRIEATDLQTRHRRMEAALAERTRWAENMERQFRHRSRWADELNARNAELDQRVLDLAGSLEQSEHHGRELEASLNVALGRIDALTDERARIFASRSWRLTRPLRVGTRLIRNARQAQLWKPRHWPALLARLRHNIRHFGLRRALWLMQSAQPAREPEPARRTISEPPREDAPLAPVTLPRASAPTASIIIPVFNKAHYTRACLASLVRATVRTPFEVIVVDDCSSDGTAEFLSSCHGLTVVRNPRNLGFIHSCNAGAERARGSLLVFLNNDTTVGDDWLDALVGTFDDFPQAGVAGARLVYPDGTLQEAGGIIFNDGSGWNYGRGDRPERPEYGFACEADYVSGACLAIPAALFAELDGFDRHFAPAYYEDTDLCFRVRQAGRQVIYQPLCEVIHHEGVTSGTDESGGVKRYQAVNREKFEQRWREVLTAHPPPITDRDADPDAAGAVRRARHHRRRGRILFIDATTPQPDHDSGSVRLCAMLEIARDMGYQVAFMPENLAWMGDYSRALARAGIEVLTWPQVENTDTWLARHGPTLDAIVVSRHYVLQPLMRALRKHCRRARLVFDTVDLHFLREEREAALTGSEQVRLQATQTRKQELALIRSSDCTLVVSPVEQKLLTERLPHARVAIVSNIHAVHGSRAGWSERQDLLFVGGFRHTPNVDAALWLAESIFPLIRARLPEIKLHLIGSHMPPEVRDISQPGIIVHGFVADLDPWLESCRLSLAPLRYGAGVKGKVNQAMSHGLPVVATRCAAEGMFLEHGRDILVADDAAEFAQCVVRAYRSESLWRTLSAGGLDNVHRHFSFEAARAALEQVLGRST